MKSVLLSVKPQHVVNILNGLKTIEIRKKFPKDYVGWVYIYVTRNHKRAGWKKRDTLKRDSHDGKPTNHFQLWTDDMVEDNDKLNSKVVARFWCDKVEKIRSYLEPEQWYMTSDLGGSGLLEKSCLSFKELDDYLLSGEGYAIHITKLEIFEKSKELGEFDIKIRENVYRRRKVPQSWCYCEVDL